MFLSDFGRKMNKEAGVIGLSRLVEELRLKVPAPAVRSEAVRGGRRTRISGDSILEQYPLSYAPTDLLGHIRFAMRYEPLDVGVIAAAFQKIQRQEVENWVRSEYIGKYVRRAWYLYELLTGNTLDVPDVPPTNNVLLLDPALHVTTAGTRIRRQRVIDNLLGDRGYCPTIRRTEALEAAMARGLEAEAKKIVGDCDPIVLRRAIHYLFSKETKSSFAIEGEKPSSERTERFLQALTHAPEFDTSSKAAFVELQNTIVDARYAQKDWRTGQNYVSEPGYHYVELVQFVCAKPEDVGPLMDGWMRMVARVEKDRVDAVCTAALTGFGFVFVHPFEDGNGRIHRFLIHHSLAKLGYTPQGIVFPVSAVMVRNLAKYDKALTAFSGKIGPFVEYRMDEPQRMTVLNETKNLYQYFDATPQAEYLYECVAETIEKDLREEIGFIQRYDHALDETKEIVDMPDRRASLLVRLILQNKGRLAKNKRDLFSEVTDEELAKIEKAMGEVAE
jgi:Fic family protein